ncbi:hypothetical protein ACFPN1_13675 [Lysobacter yangpyeongensis]|uniref:Uncharacterized protein n=1 Tax=Lysobacter yangpyeongensis TaxID=346182 RepID=A0ABW0SQP2_9GAMM
MTTPRNRPPRAPARKTPTSKSLPTRTIQPRRPRAEDPTARMVTPSRKRTVH